MGVWKFAVLRVACLQVRTEASLDIMVSERSSFKHNNILKSIIWDVIWVQMNDFSTYYTGSSIFSNLPLLPLLRNASTPTSSSQARDIGRMHPLRLVFSIEIFNKNAMTGTCEDRTIWGTGNLKRQICKIPRDAAKAAISEGKQCWVT